MTWSSAKSVFGNCLFSGSTLAVALNCERLNWCWRELLWELFWWIAGAAFVALGRFSGVCVDAGSGCGLFGKVFLTLGRLFLESELWGDVWCRAPQFGLKQRLDEGQSFFKWLWPRQLKQRCKRWTCCIRSWMEESRYCGQRVIEWCWWQRGHSFCFFWVFCEEDDDPGERDRWFVWSREVRFNSFGNSGLNL